jgi:DNA-binding transcriptional LysR family regulator
LLTSNLVNREEIAYETLVRSRRRLWVSSDHCLLKRKSLTLHEISDEPYIMLTVDEANSTTQRYWCHTPYRPNVAFSTSSVEAVRSMVSNGIGITILSDMVYRPWSLEGKRVEVMTVSDDVPSMDIGLAWRRDQERKDATDAFREFMLLATGR